MNELVQNILVWAPGVILAITLHEWAHGFAAFLHGDQTAARMGRLTMNPLPHIDPVMTLLVPGLMLASSMLTTGTPFVFGGAKPVPVNAKNFNRSGIRLRLALFWVAIAGPLVNLLLAMVCALLLQVVTATSWQPPLLLIKIVVAAMQMNIILAVFNLLPLPPLDGGRIAVALLPPPLDRALASLERFGLPLVLLLAFFGKLGEILTPMMSVTIKFFIGVANPS